jgi:hypothetical protein
MLCHINKCTEAAAHIVLQGKNWTLTLEELDKFIALIYACGLYGCLIRVVMMEASTSETLVNFYQTLRCSNLEDSHLDNVIVVSILDHLCDIFM